KIQLISGDLEASLKNSPARIVILGIPEDFGPRANHGFSGASNAWETSIRKFLNIQENKFLSGTDFILAGQIKCGDLQKRSLNLNHDIPEQLKQLRELVSELDQRVTEIIECIVSNNKLPIVIGGGHNNAYGLLAGSSKALGRKINCINLDPHADYRPLEGRHSGNGFSYAANDGFLDKYFVLGLHESYNSKYMLDQSENGAFEYITFDRMIGDNIDFEQTIARASEYVNHGPVGIEIDLDSIENMPTSAKSPSGFSVNDVRYFSKKVVESLQSVYVHIAEGAPKDPQEQNMVGKTVSYLIADICKVYLKKTLVK